MMEKAYIDIMKQSFGMYKKLCDKSIAQVEDAELHWRPDRGSNSISVIIQHIAGNLSSRWRDYLTTDGEKPERDRDAEFREQVAERAVLLDSWEKGWRVLFAALEDMSGEILSKMITIRTQPLSVLEALNRSLAHTAYHTGQIVYIAKAVRSSEWKTLSFPRGSQKNTAP